MKGIKNLGKAGILFILGITLGAAFSASAKTINFGGSGDYSYFISRIGINDSTPDALLSVNSTGSTPLILLGDRASISTDTGEKIIFRNMEELRFTDTNDWLYNSWAGIRYDQATTRLFFGGAADRDFADDGTPSAALDIIFTGVKNVGISSSTPQAKLAVGGQSGVDGILFPDGTLQTTAFSMAGNWYVPATRVSSGEFGSLTGGGDYVFPRDLTVSNLRGSGSRMVVADSQGKLSATTIPSMPSGTSGQTLRNNGLGSWVANSTIYNDGTNVGIGTTDTGGKKFYVNGDSGFYGNLTLYSCSGWCGSGLIKYFIVGAVSYLDFSNASVYRFSNRVRAAGFEYSDGTVYDGQTVNVIVKGSSGANCTLTFKGGILTSENCP